ncbi:hypothetical protein DYB31_006008 [Aphanomyces astaci]|uniref:Uncharacterized protein n=1 Tax=Aphanomyces astaci TaxID=112090 RepID=A0A397FKR7_APHAT|nr:hypothetical protein DYB31_006008 [Aphanomyces astaci]
MENTNVNVTRSFDNFDLGSMAASSQVLVLGAAGVGKEGLVEAVVRQVDASKGISWTKGASSFRAHPATISTKYYTAAVEFHVHSQPFSGDWTAYEACLLVWNANDKSSWSHVQNAVEGMGEHSFDVLMAVACGSNIAINMENAMDWCLERGVEHVAVDLASSEPAASSSDDLASKDGTTGMARIVEALECTMWKSMEMKHGHAAPAAISSDALASSEPDPSPPELPSFNAAPPSVSSTAIPTSSAQPSANTNNNNGVEEFETLLHEVQAIRSQMQGVSDDQRRARAAEMAMKLWEMMGNDDSDSD